MAKPTYLNLRELATYIRKLRKKQDLRQQDVADRLGMGRTQISELERLGPDFSLETARKVLVELAGTTIDRKEIQVPIRKATKQEKARVRSTTRSIKDGEKLPPVKTEDLDDLDPAHQAGM